MNTPILGKACFASKATHTISDDVRIPIRSRPANCEDALLCDLFARHAVHAAMAGKTGVVIGFLHERFIHVPIELLATHSKRLDPASGWWRSVLAATGQPAQFSCGS
jgi:6-phosphofructokinase 1